MIADTPHTAPSTGQWFRARRADVEARSDLAPALRLAAEELQGELRIDNQRARLGPGAAIGIPVWQVATWADPAAVVVLFADEALLEVEPANGSAGRVAVGWPVVLRPGDRLRFHPATTAQDAELVLLRVATPELGPARERMSARVFAPPPRPPVSAGAEDAIDWSAQRTLRFDSRPEVVAALDPATDDEIASEPNFAACGIPLALEIGGPLLRRFVEALPPAWREPGADVRVGVERNELSPGWNPCHVNYHMDGSSRLNKRADGHPDLINPGRTVEQMIACFGTGAPTRFLIGTVDLPEPPMGDLAPATGLRWKALLDAGVAAGTLVEWIAPPNTLVAFGHGDFHTGSTSTEPGWRCFVKAMRFRRDPLPTEPTFRHHDTITWPIDAPSFPSDPCGVFPDEVRGAVRAVRSASRGGERS